MMRLLICFAVVAPLAGHAAPEKKRVPVGPNVALEVEGKQRRVIVQAAVCLRKGPLEGLLTRKMKKEHEYVLAADLDARHLHTALELAGAKAGKPVQFAPKYQPASGSRVRITLRYEKDGKRVTVPSSAWIKHAKTGKVLEQDWVFAGSKMVADPDTKQLSYIANHGDVVCVCNMESALLDLPVESPKKFDIRSYEAATDAIPENGTKVEVIFEVVR